MFIDSHCHLFYEDFKDDLADVIARAESAGVTSFVVPATNHETAHYAIDLAERFESVYACVGFHPLDLEQYSEDSFKKIEDLVSHPKVVAIGEIGIDYFYDTSPRDLQREVFSRQIDFAIKKDMPIVVHTRDSMDDALEIVTTFAERNPQWKKGGKRGVFHCFSGTAEQARILFDHQFLVSFPGPVTFKKNTGMVETLKEIGADHIMVETDSPYLTPVPYRGKRNEPSYIPLIAQKIAEILDIPVEDVAAKTSHNARSIFSIK